MEELSMYKESCLQDNSSNTLELPTIFLYKEFIRIRIFEIHKQ